ncbi:hypothetical protein SASPL_120246 [Salvia splendens]|uniref:TF-B3 domain-containing protein n=1 Tax=Salvia splendens TaxID=180675 RepID=A0A8X8ZV32_SALSN|nr:hypothetical protein SASPL_120246 [Salvia splendens]
MLTNHMVHITTFNVEQVCAVVPGKGEDGAQILKILDPEFILDFQSVGFSCGWRAFAHDNKLDNGDAVVLKLIETTKFKVVYDYKAWNVANKRYLLLLFRG